MPAGRVPASLDELLLRGGYPAIYERDLAVNDFAVRRFEEAILIQSGIQRERVDESNVRTFRRLDRAHPAVVAEVHVPDLEPGTLTAESARPEGREATPMGQTRQRVDLVHELAEL